LFCRRNNFNYVTIVTEFFLTSHNIFDIGLARNILKWEVRIQILCNPDRDFYILHKTEKKKECSLFQRAFKTVAWALTFTGAVSTIHASMRIHAVVSSMPYFPFCYAMHARAG